MLLLTKKVGSHRDFETHLTKLITSEHNAKLTKLAKLTKKILTFEMHFVQIVRFNE
jgi:hypothetical protein